MKAFIALADKAQSLKNPLARNKKCKLIKTEMTKLKKKISKSIEEKMAVKKIEEAPPVVEPVVKKKPPTPPPAVKTSDDDSSSSEDKPLKPPPTKTKSLKVLGRFYFKNLPIVVTTLR